MRYLFNTTLQTSWYAEIKNPSRASDLSLSRMPAYLTLQIICAMANEYDEDWHMEMVEILNDRVFEPLTRHNDEEFCIAWLKQNDTFWGALDKRHAEKHHNEAVFAGNYECAFDMATLFPNRQETRYVQHFHLLNNLDRFARTCVFGLTEAESQLEIYRMLTNGYPNAGIFNIHIVANAWI